MLQKCQIVWPLVAAILFSSHPRAMALGIASSCRASAAARSRIVSVKESSWRAAASSHQERMRSLLKPGLTSADHPLNSGGRRRRRGDLKGNEKGDGWTALDPRNPVYNFLIEYYGVKGGKGPRRLGRWSPNPALILGLGGEGSKGEELGDLMHHTIGGGDDGDTAPFLAGGVLLEGATEDDFGGTLHLRGAMIPGRIAGGTRGGVLYSPALYQRRFEAPGEDNDVDARGRASSPYQWYRSILASTLSAEPVLHCHGLHEWAMQYHPQGAPPPPSGKYQNHLPLRVDRGTINAAVERRGVSCTHVDALRFFAPAAGPLNHHGHALDRTDQLRLEQPACVHAHMDLLKLAMRLQPFVDSALVGDCLEVALASRRLDVEASPYDGSEYGLGVVPVERSAGRKLYRERQEELMETVRPVRERLLGAYDAFLELAFDERDLGKGELDPAPERYARAEPGGLPWRKNLIGESK